MCVRDKKTHKAGNKHCKYVHFLLTWGKNSKTLPQVGLTGECLHISPQKIPDIHPFARCDGGGWWVVTCGRDNMTCCRTMRTELTKNVHLLYCYVCGILDLGITYMHSAELEWLRQMSLCSLTLYFHTYPAGKRWIGVTNKNICTYVHCAVRRDMHMLVNGS